jgi:hypothetical protein
VFRSATPQSIIGASRALFFIAALAFVAALGLWLWGNQQSEAASTLNSAPSCMWAGQRDCIATVSVTSEGTGTTTSCNGRGGCQDIHMVTVLFPDGHTLDLQIAAGRIPLPEFDQGQQLMADVYNGVVETVEGPFGTVLRTFANPTGQDTRYHEIAMIVAGTGAGLLFLGWLFRMRSSGPVPEVTSVA